MPDYSKTIIYKIQHEDNEELVYVGSTTDFTKRKCHHKSNSNNPNGKHYNFKLYQMMRENGGWNCFKMIQIKEFPCENRRQAEGEEDKIMLELRANMNSIRASRTYKQYCEDNKEKIKEYDKKYYEDHKEEITEYKKQYYEDHKEEKKEYDKKYREFNKERITYYHKQYREVNKERILQKDKKYYENNKEKITDYNKQYREVNKEQLLQQKKQYYEKNKEKLLERLTCDCGCVVNKMSLLRHKRTTKHTKLLNETLKQ